MRSVNGGDLSVVLSVPIRAEDFSDVPSETVGAVKGNSTQTQPLPHNKKSEAVLGVLGMSIDLGRFADLQVDLPEGQGVMLVEGRRYHMLGDDRKSKDERGDGLVLHHKHLHRYLQASPLPHVDDAILQQMVEAVPRWQNRAGHQPAAGNLLPGDYRDPLTGGESGNWLAAFAPVLVAGREAEEADTGWFVIVLQRRYLPSSNEWLDYYAVVIHGNTLREIA
jgi:hypothetical protein